MNTDPYWVFENFDEAATYIDTIEARVAELEAVLVDLKLELKRCEYYKGQMDDAIAKIDEALKK